MMDAQLLIPRTVSIPAIVQRVLQKPKAFYTDPKLHLKLDYLERGENAARWLYFNGEPMYQGFVQPKGLINKRCWLNSFILRYEMADKTDNFLYAEGVSVCPVPQGYYYEMHGWNMRSGHVYDSTYGRAFNTRYFGVVFSDEFLRFTTFITGYGLGLLNQFDLLWPYLDNYVAERDRKRGLR